MVLIEVDPDKHIYRCKICGKEYKTFYELDIHMTLNHKAEIDKEYMEANNLPIEVKEESNTNNTNNNTNTSSKSYNLQDYYNEGPYVLVINDNLVLRANSYKELFEAYITYLMDMLDALRMADPELYNLFKDAYNNFGYNPSKWRAFILHLADSLGVQVKDRKTYKGAFDVLKKLNFIKDYYYEPLPNSNNQ